jgi:hypothetical protein
MTGPLPGPATTSATEPPATEAPATTFTTTSVPPTTTATTPTTTTPTTTTQPTTTTTATTTPTTTTTTTTTTESSTTSASRTTDPARPSDGPDAALFDAVATEHGVIYGYGLVSAHSSPEVNDIVAEAMAAHRKLREDAIARLTGRDVTAPLPAIGYEIPIRVDTPEDAALLATRMEEDSAVAWRAVLEQATTAEDRTFAVTALTQAAVTAARWRAVVGTSPSTVAFPGGTE